MPQSNNNLGPYIEESQNKIYNLLFGDDLSLFLENQLPVFPLNLLNKDMSDKVQMLNVANDITIQSRYRLIFWKELIAKGIDPVQMEVLGVVVEVGLENGLDVVAAYKDGSCRYINHTGKTIFFDSPNEESLKLTTDLITNGQAVANKIGPWDKPRREFPKSGTVRLSFLANDGLYFGEGAFEIMYQDKMASPVINVAISLMNHLIDRVLSKN